VALPVTRARLDAAVQRLVAALAPEEVILFGSQARGTARPDSDADLLAVLPAAAAAVPVEERRRRAWLAVRGDLAQHNFEADVFAYTVAEMRHRLAAGDTLIRDALAEGAVLYPTAGLHSRYAACAGEWSQVDTVEAWLRYADQDLQEGKGARFPRNAAYHAQQAAEKALKALIFHLGGEPARIHDLSQLLLDIAALDRPVGTRLLAAHQNAAAELTMFAVTPRYPGAGDVSPEQARSAVAAAQAIVTAVRQAVGPSAADFTPQA
jgi:HEPN domain-containing protein